MMHMAKKYLALAAAVTMTALGSTGCSKQSSVGVDRKNAGATVAVDMSSVAAVIGDIGRLEVQIQDLGNAPTFPAFTTVLTQKANNVWSGQISNIPANPTPGSTRRFIATAYNKLPTHDAIYSGQTDAPVIAGQIANVTIIMQEINPQLGPNNSAPRITSITSTASYVGQSQKGTFTVAAMDPDHVTSPGGPFDGTPLGYQWSSNCTAGALSFDTGTDTTPVATWTAPGVNSTCTIAIRVSETGIAQPLSVTTYFTVTVNANFGDAKVLAFPNSFPIVTVQGNFRYNYFADVLTMPWVGQEGDLHFTATDPDGDNVTYTLDAQCGGAAIAGAYFSDVSYTTTAVSAFNPTFGQGNYGPGHAAGTTLGALVAHYTVPTDDCQFRIQVQDLCTNGNCIGDPTAVGTIADGQPKVGIVNGVTVHSDTIGYINATHPARAVRAPIIERETSPNQDGLASNGAQSWDLKKMTIVDPGQTVLLQVYADDRYEKGNLSATWLCNVGTPNSVTNSYTTVDPSVGSTTYVSELSWTAPASLSIDMSCQATITSSSGAPSTVGLFRFSGSDPCIGQADNAACNDLNPCTTGDHCVAQKCTGTPVVCVAPTDPSAFGATNGQCRQAGVCQQTGPQAGQCSYAPVNDGNGCNNDSNGCTSGDSCQAGSCVAGSGVVCNATAPANYTPPNGYCYAAAGTCRSTSSATFACDPIALPATTACSVGNAAVKCSGANTFASFACDGAGSCVGSSPTACNNTPPCITGNSCSAASGTCAGGTVAPATTPCNDGKFCTTGDHCDGTAGNCVGGSPTCAAGQRCDDTLAMCIPMVTPQSFADLLVTPPAGLAMDVNGNTYATATIITNVATAFGPGPNTTMVKSSGGNDIFIAKYDVNGQIQWAAAIGDDTLASTNQNGARVAISNNGTMVLAGKFAGQMTFGTNVLSSTPTINYLAAVDGNTGSPTIAPTRRWGAQFDLGANGDVKAIAAHPNRIDNRIAVCGNASIAATGLVPGATYGGGSTDLVLAVFDSNGNRLWSIQLGGTGNETCNTVAFDDNGDVIAAGQFDGATLTLPGSSPITLTGPGSTSRKFMWIARFAGAGLSGGADVKAAQVYSGSAGAVNPTSIAIATHAGTGGDVLVAANFTSDVTVGTPITAVGADDTFVAKFNDAALTPSWISPVQFGGNGIDQSLGIAATSTGDAIVTGKFQAAWSIGPALTSAGGYDAFVAKINGAAGILDDAHRYGNAANQTGDAVVVNRFGVTPDQITFGTSIASGADFGPPAGAVTPLGANDAVLVFSRLQ
jgi:hypothetical protein